MSSSKTKGRAVDTKALNAEAASWASTLAKKARLEEPLPAGQDISEEDFVAAQCQVLAWDEKPRKIKDLMITALCAKYASTLAKNLRSLSLDDQPNAFATYVQLFSLFPEAYREPYYRLFLQSPNSKGLTNLIANAFLEGFKWLLPSGPGHISGLFIELLFWCDTSEGDDKKAAMDADLRRRIAQTTHDLTLTPEFPRLDFMDQANIKRLNGILHVIDEMPNDYYLISTRDHLTGQAGEGYCANGIDCEEVPTTQPMELRVRGISERPGSGDVFGCREPTISDIPQSDGSLWKGPVSRVGPLADIR